MKRSRKITPLLTSHLAFVTGGRGVPVPFPSACTCDGGGQHGLSSGTTSGGTTAQVCTCTVKVEGKGGLPILLPPPGGG